MEKRFSLIRDPDGTFSIVDLGDGCVASYWGRDLTRIPADLASYGLQISNALDDAERVAAALSARTDRVH